MNEVVGTVIKVEIVYDGVRNLLKLYVIDFYPLQLVQDITSVLSSPV